VIFKSLVLTKKQCAKLFVKGNASQRCRPEAHAVVASLFKKRPGCREPSIVTTPQLFEVIDKQLDVQN